MRPILLSAAFLVLSTLQAQEPSLYIVPRWKVGDTRKMAITQVQRDTEDGKTTEHRDELQALVRVVNEEGTNFILRVQYDNVIMHRLRELGSAINTDLTPYEHVMLRYTVSKRNGEAHLENWKEVQTMINKCFDDVVKGVNKQDTASAAMATLIVTPMLGIFNDQKGVEAYFHEVIDYVTFAYGKRIGEKDTLRTISYLPNPFAPNDSVQVTTSTRLEKIDREQQQAVLHGTVAYDLSAFKAMMVQLMQQMAGGTKMSATERRNAEARTKAQLKNTQFDLTTEGSYTVDLHTTWALSYTGVQRMFGSSGGRSKESTTTTTVTITK